MSLLYGSFNEGAVTISWSSKWKEDKKMLVLVKLMLTHYAIVEDLPYIDDALTLEADHLPGH